MNVLDRVRRGSIPGYSRMSSGVRGMLVRPDDSFFKAIPNADVVQQATVLKEQISNGYMTDPTVYMILCLVADLLIWTLAGFIIYRAVKSCRKSTITEETQKLAADKYDRLEADFDSCSLSSCDSDLNEYEQVRPKWIPVLFSSDGRIKKMSSSEVKTFHLPFALNRCHSIPNFVEFDKHGANFV